MRNRLGRFSSEKFAGCTAPDSMGQICVSAARFLGRAPRLDHGKAKVWWTRSQPCGGGENIAFRSRGFRKISLCVGEQAISRKHRCEKEQASSGITMATLPCAAATASGPGRCEGHPSGT